MKDLKVYTDYLRDNKISKEDAVKLLREDKSGLTADEKNLIYAYTYPRLLGDYELPSRVKSYREKRGCKNGYLVPDMIETTLIIEAARTPQYERFIKHLYYSFGGKQVFPVKGERRDNTCPICGKQLFEWDIWTKLSEGKEEAQKQEFLEYSCENSDIRICKNCLCQLLNSIDYMKMLCPDFLGSWKSEKDD